MDDAAGLALLPDGAFRAGIALESRLELLAQLRRVVVLDAALRERPI